MTEKEKCTIWIRAWQLERYEQPLKIGETFICPAGASSREILDGQKIDYFYDHYDYSDSDDKMCKISGVIDEIKAVYSRKEWYSTKLRNGKTYNGYRDIYCKVIDKIEADGKEPDVDDLQCGAYAITLINCTIQPMNYEEYETIIEQPLSYEEYEALPSSKNNRHYVA